MSCGAGSVSSILVGRRLHELTHLHLFERFHALQQVDLGRVGEALVERGVVDLRVGVSSFVGWRGRVGRRTQMMPALKIGYVKKGGH